MADMDIFRHIVTMGMNKMIDIHNHIIQGVDDGSKDIEMSLDMARIYLENGIKKVIATPHYIEKDSLSLERNKKALEVLRDALRENDLDLEVYLGNEVYISMDILKDIREKRVATLNGSRYVLLEFPMEDIPIYADSVIYELLINGYIPIIAHPERYIKIQEDPNILFNFIKKGALAQLNLPSIQGFYGKKVKETARILLENKMIHFVGTDAHTNRKRSPEVREALALLKDLVSSKEYMAMTEGNAKNIIEDREHISSNPIKYEKEYLLDSIANSFFNFFRASKA